MTRSVHKKTEIIEDYTDSGFSNILVGILIGIGLVGLVIYIKNRSKTSNIPSLSSHIIQQTVQSMPPTQSTITTLKPDTNEKWKIVRNESGGIEEIEILKNIPTPVNITNDNNTETIILRPENINIHKSV